MAQILSGQCYGFSKNFENFYLDRDLGFEGTFGGPRLGGIKTPAAGSQPRYDALIPHSGSVLLLLIR